MSISQRSLTMKAKQNGYQTVPETDSAATLVPELANIIRRSNMPAVVKPQRRAAHAVSSIGPAALLHVIEWLASDECHDSADADLIVGLGRRLRTAGLPIDRLMLHLRTLHPEIVGRTTAWSPNEVVEVQDRRHGLEAATDFIGNP